MLSPPSLAIDFVYLVTRVRDARRTIEKKKTFDARQISSVLSNHIVIGAVRVEKDHRPYHRRIAHRFFYVNRILASIHFRQLEDGVFPALVSCVYLTATLEASY